VALLEITLSTAVCRVWSSLCCVTVMLHIIFCLIIHSAGGNFVLCDQQFMIVVGCSVNLTAHGFIHVSDLMTDRFH
jgi:hypothetical protein